MRLLFLTFLLASTGCSQATFYRRPTADESQTLIWENDLTLAQQTYLLKLRTEPTDFDMDPQAAEDAWERANAFVDMYGGMRIRNANAFEIKTFTSVAPAGFVPKDCSAAYLVTREPEGERYRFSIRTAVSAPDWVPCELGRQRNALILAQYLRTGDLPHPELIQR